MEATEFIKPKTDWFGETVNGVYRGDRFNIGDYNRIANNLTYLPKRINKLYGDNIKVMDFTEKTYNDMLYASDINLMNSALGHLDVSNTVSSYGNYEKYSDFTEDDFVMDYNYLNNMEHACEYIYNEYCFNRWWIYQHYSGCKLSKMNHNYNVKNGEAYYVKITELNQGYVLYDSDVSVHQDGVDIKSEVYNHAKREINIPHVTGDISIRITPQRR